MDSTGDEAVIATNDDAAFCKYQAITKGYYKDSFLEQILPAKVRSWSSKKPPEISRGYYARSASISYLIEQFISQHESCQIISLGAGYDSLFWRLKSHKFCKESESDINIKFVELDMSSVVMRKIMAIKRQPKLLEQLSSVVYKGEGLHSTQYHLISADLRQQNKSSLGTKLFEDCKIDPDKPTLCIAECVLVYMPVEDSSSLINWLASNLAKLTVLNYEQCNMKDRFGEIMLSHMNQRHCDLMGVAACESLDTQADRFKSNKLAFTQCWTLSEIFNKLIAPSEISRIEQIEFLDEKELLEQLLQHYCIVLGSNQPLEWLQDDNYWLAKTL